MARERTHRVGGPALRELAYPARIEIVEALMSEQPATVDDIARRLGRSAKALYHHLRPLLRAGLVEEAGQRPTARRPATLYRLPAMRLELDPEDRSRTALEARHDLARAVFRTALRRNERELASPDVVLGGRRRTLMLGHRVARLTPTGLGRVNAKVKELMDLLVEEHDERGRPFALTVQVVPTGEATDRAGAPRPGDG